jgi:hypothetical protein
MNSSIYRYNYVAGGEDGKGLVETVKEKAADAYVFSTYLLLNLHFISF